MRECVYVCVRVTERERERELDGCSRSLASEQKKKKKRHILPLKNDSHRCLFGPLLDLRISQTFFNRISFFLKQIRSIFEA